MGLGTVKEVKNMYLSIAGGYIWDRKADSTNLNYATQDFNRADGTVGIRQGARYADLTAKILGVEFRVHEKFGESINITTEAGGDRFIIAVSTNNQYSQCFMKALLLMDLNKDLYIKPYDFTGTDGKRAQGISFRQDGVKIDLKEVKLPKEFIKEKEFWKTSDKKKIKRFFEDLSDYFVGEVEAKVCSQLTSIPPQKKKEDSVEQEQPKTPPAKESDEAASGITSEQIAEESRPSQIKMKKAIKAYISENYDSDEVMPKLSKEEIVVWYDLALAEEELPFPIDGEVAGSELDDALAALIPGK